MPGGLLARDLDDQAPLGQVLEHRFAVHAADRLDHGLGHRLAVGDDRERLHGRPAQARRALGVERALHRPGHLRAGDQLDRLVGALEHQPATAQVHGEHPGRPGDRRGAALEDRRRLGDGDLATEREAERLERGRKVLGLGVGGALGHRGAAEDVEHEHVIHGRSP